MRYNALTQLSAKSSDKGKYADGQGLWLVKRDKQFGKWILRLVVKGKRREMGLGRWPDVAIAEARERAAGARKQLRDGADPIEERAKQNHAPKAVSVADAAQGCFEAKKAELKNEDSKGRWLALLNRNILSKLGKMPIESLTQHHIKDALGPIWHEKPESARKSLNRLNMTLKYAAALGLDVDMQATMKARALLGKQRHKVTHIPSMPYKDAPKFYHWLTTLPGSVPLALRFLILTVARTSEVRLATAAEIDGDIWTLPPDRTKTGQEHRIPLTDEALKVVEAANGLSPNEHLFVGMRNKPLSDMAMSSFMKRESYEARPHGFRATFRTWVEEQTDTPFEVKETALGHAVDTGVVGAYQRSDRLEKRHKLAKRWADFVVTETSLFEIAQLNFK